MIRAREQRSGSGRLVALALAVGLLINACSNSGDDDSADATTPPTADTADDTEPAETTAPTVDTEPVETAPVATDTVDTAPSDTGPDVGTFEPIAGVPGVTDEAINFAVLGTGPSNPLGYCLLECYQGGVQAFFDYQNGLGGVNGRDLVISRVDDDEVGNTQVKALELIGDDSIFGIFAAPLQYAGFSDIGASAVPLYTTFPASVEANGFESVFIPGGTQCTTCSTPSTVQGALIAGGTKAASLGSESPRRRRTA